ncbi:MAG: DUF4209 domain-containing protein [Verrucomicrobiota bacterium]|nr:DUF4209 domain-containing protein [Verrucomicrobiota bacterium]
MSDPNQSRFNVTADDLRRYDWQSRIAKHPRKECSSYYEVFVPSFQECERTGDDLGQRVYSFLNTLSSFRPNYDAKGNPYGPVWSHFDGQRSLIAQDLTDEDLQVLRGVLEEIADPEYRARVGDVLWESKRDYKAAQIAVRAFLESAEWLKTDDLWPPYTARLERAVQLAAKLGFGKPLHQEVVAAIESAIKEFENNLKSGLLCHRLMLTALGHDASDLARYAALSERLATELAAAGESDFSHRYWLLAAHWHRKLKSEAEAQRCELAAAEGMIAATERSVGENKLGFGNAAFWLGRAVEQLRHAKADPARIKEVHQRFAELQKQALGEMGPMDLKVDEIPGFREAEQQVQEAAAAHVRGHPFEEALERLVHVTKPTNVADLRKQMESQSEKFIWEKIVGTNAIDYSGKVADKRPPSGLGSTGVEEATMRKKMVQNAREIQWQIEVTWKIEPARVTILKDHEIRRRDLFFLVAGNPFIPAGHEEIYVRGLQAGFLGDWLVAMHLLVPQLEASIRHVLQQNSVVTSTLDPEGIQQERDLNQLLWTPAMERIFGPNITFDLRGILIERFGHNMRNEFAHGLMPEGAFYQPASVYLWWLLLRLCWMGYGLTQAPPDKPTK